ncbi:MAG: hypothetical protein LPK88_11235 [Alphaproteobacteria bacterium]|nr:hypothetical protein [Alphaproteobacteria bacterium]MDX5416871.1 hypothetical protein [Alphaproteobacteria bacterium]MDX5494266.1 hypothetical protein [Alphaproteobacteria bacterium]
MQLASAARVVALAAALPLVSLPAGAAEPLPSAAFRLSCVPGEGAKLDAEFESIQALLDFARRHDGEAVYLDAAIEADAGAGFCSRDLATPMDNRIEPGEGPSRISFNGCRTESDRRCIEKDMVQIDADGPPLVYRHSIVLPDETSLPKNLPYGMGRYGDWQNYRGPFIARFHEGTGYAYASFHVPDAALSYIWRRATTNPKRPVEDE